jgi:hypothetical protein
MTTKLSATELFMFSTNPADVDARQRLLGGIRKRANRKGLVLGLIIGLAVGGAAAAAAFWLF